MLCKNEHIYDKISVRVPYIPGVNDSMENIRETARFVRDTALVKHS